MIERDVLGQARSLQVGAERDPGRRRSRRRGSARALSIVSKVQKQWTTRTRKPFDEERAVAPAPRVVLGQVAAQSRDVVAAVVVDDEQAAPRAQDAIGLGELRRRRRRGSRTRRRRSCRPSRGTAAASPAERLDVRRPRRRRPSSERSRPAPPPTNSTSRSASGPSASSARSILRSRSRARRARRRDREARLNGRSDTRPKDSRA